MQDFTENIIATLRAQGCSLHNAEEVAQDVAVSLIINTPEIITWSFVRQLAQWKWVSKMRRESRYCLTDDMSHLVQNDTEVPDPKMDVLLSCLSKLNSKDQETLRIHYWDGLSRQEAAAKTGLTQNGWKNRLQRAKSKLKNLCIAE